MSKNTGTSELINYFDLGANGDVGIAGSLDINTIANATTDTDTFLVSDTGIIKYRTGAQLLSDIGAAPATGGSYLPLAGGTMTGSFQGVTGSNFVGTSVNSRLLVTASGVANTVIGFNNSGSTTDGVTNNTAYVGVLQAYPLVFTTDSVERMRISASGNVGIGVNPSTFLHVFGANTANRGQLSIQSNNVSNGARATFYYDTFNAGEIGTTGSDLYALATNNLIFYASGDIRMQIKGSNVLIGSSTDDGPRLKVLRPNDSGSIIRIGNSDSTYFDFSRNQTNGALSIQGNQIGFNNIALAPSGGNVLIGTTTDTGYKLKVQGSTFSEYISIENNSAPTVLLQCWNKSNSGDNKFVEFYTEGGGGALRGSIDYNRVAGLTRYNTLSDYRLKTEIEDFNANAIIQNLKPKKYRMIDAKEKIIGFIAHELQEFYPQAVSGKKDQVNNYGLPIYQGIDYSQLTGLLVKAIQELKQEIDTLKN